MTIKTITITILTVITLGCVNTTSNSDSNSHSSSTPPSNSHSNSHSNSNSNSNSSSPSPSPSSSKIDTSLIYRTDTYHESNGDIIIQHGYPRGGGDLDGLRGYQNQEGQQFGHAFFWTRLVNETSESIDLDISFPGDSIKYDKSDSAYLKFFIVPSPFDLSQLEEYSYGIKGFRYHLDTAFYEPQIAQSSIPPGGDFGFYMAVLTHEGFYAWRNTLLIDGDSLKYSVRTNATDSLVIDLGRLRRNW